MILASSTANHIAGTLFGLFFLVLFSIAGLSFAPIVWEIIMSIIDKLKGKK